MTEAAKFEFLTEAQYALLSESQQMNYLKHALDFHCSDLGGWRAFFSDTDNDPVPGQRTIPKAPRLTRR